MNKKKMTILTLLILTVILSISMASAADADNNQTTDTITEQTTIENTEPVQNDIPETYTKEITKGNKQDVKEAGTRVDVNNYNELVNQVNKIQQSTQKEYTINLKPGNYNATTEMTLEQKNGINYKVTINGNNIILNGQKKYTFMEIKNCSLELIGITLKNFTITEHGGVIYSNNSNCTITDSSLTNNSAYYYNDGYGSGSGGAIYSVNSNCIIINSNVTNNYAGLDGGAIYSVGNCSIINSTINNNNAYEGGAIYSAGYCSITNSKLTDNYANNGGALYNRGNLNINNSTINNNIAIDYMYGDDSSGGAIYSYGNCIIENSILKNNSADYDGGAIYGSCNIINSTFNDNEALRNGGAIYGDCTITNSILTENTAIDCAGAIYSSNCLIYNSSLTNNRADYGNGGVIYCNHYNGNVKVISSNLSDNQAKNGGSIYIISSKLTITNSILTNNIANKGGAIYNDSSELNINNCTFNNKAEEGNNIYNNTTNTTLSLKKISEQNYRDIITIKGNLLSNDYVKFNIYLLVNNNKINLTTSWYKGEFSTNVTLNSTGKWTIKAIFEGQGRYLPSNATRTFNVVKRNTTIKTNITDAFLNEATIIKGNLTDKTNTKLRNSNIHITINSENYHILTDSKGIFTLNYTPTKKGTNNITIQYKGNKNYEATNITSTFEVYDTKIEIKSTYYRENITINALIRIENKTLQNKNVNLTINNETTTIKTDKNGMINYTCISTKAGNNTLKITYKNNTWTRTFTTQKRNTILTNTKITETTPGDLIITGTLKDNTGTKQKNANIYITINGKTEHTLTDNKATYQINHNTTHKEKYDITIQYKGNKNYDPTNLTTTYDINTTHSSDSYYTYYIKAKLTKENQILKDTYVNLTINNDTTNKKTDKNGILSYTHNSKKAGNNTLEITYNDIKWTQNFITVDKIESDIKINDIQTVTYNENVTISGMLKDIDGNPIGHTNVSIYLNGKQQQVTTYNTGIFKATFTTSTLGKQEVSVIFKGNDKYLASNTTTTFTVVNLKLLMYTVKPVTYRDTFTIQGKLTDAKGNSITNAKIQLTVNKESTTITTDANGKYTYKAQALELGQFTVTATYNDQVTGSELTATKTLEVTKRSTTLVVDSINDVEVGEEATIMGTLTDDIGSVYKNANIYITINGKQQQVKTDNKGLFTIIYTPTSIGTQNVTITYKGNANYLGDKVTTTFKATKATLKATKITVNSLPQTKADNQVTVKGKLTDHNNTPVKNTDIQITINGKLYGDNEYTNITTVTVKTNSKGTYTYNYTPNSGGNYTININFPGNQDYNANQTQTTLNVDPLDTIITVNPITNARINKKTNITGKLTDENGNPLKQTSVGIIIDNNKVYVKTDTNGKYTYEYTPTTTGTKNIKIYYGGYHKYAYSITTLNLDVKT